MKEVKQYMQELFVTKQINIPANRVSLFEVFMQDENVHASVKEIFGIQQKLMANWTIKNRVADILQQALTLPNATVGRPYEAVINLQWQDVTIISLKGLEETGLEYNDETLLIKGTPVVSGDVKCILSFTITGEAPEAVPYEKTILLIINPDPKSLWKNLPSDATAAYWKEDNAVAADPLGEKYFIAASRRGRSHANVGSFRDDDFAYKHLETTGWNVVAVADGAGSAKLARQGSKIACDAVMEYFASNLTAETNNELQNILSAYNAGTDNESRKALNHFVYGNLSKAALYVHQQLVKAAQQAETTLKDFHTTLVFVLFKKFSQGYAFLSFGVGDCPAVLLNKDIMEVIPLNQLDVGEFGGGTRFITMPDIFQSDAFASRFRFKLTDDFSYLVMMTDGVYDAKFAVEANLEKVDAWKGFIKDLQGENEDSIHVDFEKPGRDTAAGLLNWLNFWSVGNHDDRTLAIVF